MVIARILTKMEEKPEGVAALKADPDLLSRFRALIFDFRYELGSMGVAPFDLEVLPYESFSDEERIAQALVLMMEEVR